MGTKTKTKVPQEIRNKKSISREKQKETKKRVLYQKNKGFAPENGEGRSSEKVRITAKNA